MAHQEKKFYEKLLEGSEGWEFRPKTSESSNYLLSDQSEITVNIESCLGYESFARGNKVAFFSCRGSDLKIDNMDFNIQNKLYSNEGPFGQAHIVKKFRLILDKLRAITESEWLEHLAKFRKNFFCMTQIIKLQRRYIKLDERKNFTKKAFIYF